MSTPRQPEQPAAQGWVTIRAAGRVWCRFHPQRRKLHFKDGDREAYYDLSKHDERG